MLILTRKKNESITIGDDITITITEIHENSIKLGIDAPKNITVLRKELIGKSKKTK
jgi:carbon storage regulator